MRRRFFVAGLLLAAAMRRARAQRTARVYRIAFVDPVTPAAELNETSARDDPLLPSFFRELRRLGYVEGHNLLIEPFSGEGHVDHFADLARDVVRRHPDLIFTPSSRLALKFKESTTTIPIVGIMFDPVGLGIVPNLARPGGNITGVTVDAGVEIMSKRLEFLKEVSPAISKVGVLCSRVSFENTVLGTALREACKTAGVLLMWPIDGPLNDAEYRRTFSLMAQESTNGLIVLEQNENFTYRRLIIELAEKGRLPAIYPTTMFSELGGLMAYGLDIADLGPRLAGVIDRILKGTHPGEIPIYQPTKFELSINLKTAKSLGIEIPPSLLALANTVIE